jgi:hypothetical protein
LDGNNNKNSDDVFLVVALHNRHGSTGTLIAPWTKLERARWSQTPHVLAAIQILNLMLDEARNRRVYKPRRLLLLVRNVDPGNDYRE